MNITVIKPGNSIQEVPEIVAYARKMVAEFKQKYPDIDVYLTGGAMFDAAFAEIPEQEDTTLLPLMFAVLLVIVGIALRTVWATLSVLVLIALSVAISMGLGRLVGYDAECRYDRAPVIILTLSVAHCVHILATLRQEMLRGVAQHDAVVEALRINMAPIFITSVTTAIGFMSLNFSDAPPFRLLGNMVAMGVIAGFLLSVTLLPAALAHNTNSGKTGADAGWSVAG